MDILSFVLLFKKKNKEIPLNLVIIFGYREYGCNNICVKLISNSLNHGLRRYVLIKNKFN